MRCEAKTNRGYASRYTMVLSKKYLLASSCVKTEKIFGVRYIQFNCAVCELILIIDIGTDPVRASLIEERV